MRPKVTHYKKPEKISDYPEAPCFSAGHLVSLNKGWRTESPIIHKNLCTGCFYCYLCCPEGVIFKEGKKINIEYDFCKGCGICANVCKRKAVTMERGVDV